MKRIESKSHFEKQYKAIAMKKYFILCVLILQFHLSNAQFFKDLNFSLYDSLGAIENTTSYERKFEILMNIAYRYQWSKGDSAIIYFNKASKIAKENNDQTRLYLTLSSISSTYNQSIGNYPLGLYYAIESRKLVDKVINVYISNYSLDLNLVHNYNLAFSYAYLNNKELAYKYLELTWPIAVRSKPGFRNGNIGKLYYVLGNYDSALKYNRILVDFFKKTPYEKRWSGAYIIGGDIYRGLKMYDSAIVYYKLSLPLTVINSLYKDYLEASSGLTSVYAETNQLDSAIYYGTQVVRYSEKFTFTEGLLNACKILYQTYKKKGRLDSAFNYLEKSQQLSEQLYNSSKISEAQNRALREETNAKELADQEASQRKRLLAISMILILFTCGIYLNGKRKQKERLRQIEEDRKNKELQAARDLQQSMLPKENPKRPDLDIATFIRSSTEVGGDYYDFLPQENGNVYSVCGDATGHGVTSGMMVSITKAGLNGIDSVAPNIILQKLNKVVKKLI